MKSILLISHGFYEYDGRLRELIKIFNDEGDLVAFTRGQKEQFANHIVYRSKGYIGFIKESIKLAKELKGIDILVLDNRKATIPGLIIKAVCKPTIVIQDCRELYVSKDVSHFAGKVGCFFEKKMIKRSDVIIVANEERAKIMVDMYDLQAQPLVYENLRKLEYIDKDDFHKKLGYLIKDDEYRLISTSGCSISRTNDLLVKNLDKIDYKVRLFLVGSSSDEDEEEIKNIIKEKNICNVDIIETLNQSELKWLISNSHIGIVNYNQNDLNNKYCASGKIYEFLYEGLPVVTTTNPPLLNLCSEFAIGASSDDYYDAINDVIKNYDSYKNRVMTFAKEHTVEDNNKRIRDCVKERISAIVK